MATKTTKTKAVQKRYMAIGYSQAGCYWGTSAGAHDKIQDALDSLIYDNDSDLTDITVICHEANTPLAPEQNYKLVTVKGD